MNVKDITKNSLSGITVALALVPEAVAFALVAHVEPLTGLYAAFIICLITAVCGGRPGMISGATGAVAVVIGSLVVTHGVDYLFSAVILMGVFQIAFSLLRLGKLIKMVSYPVMLGFVNGLAIVIFLAQLGHFKTEGATGAVWMSGMPLYSMLALSAGAIAIIYLFPRLSKAIPSSLVAIVTISLISIGFGLETKTVGDLASIKGSLPPFHIPNVPFNMETLRIILPYSLILAAVGLIESLLTLNLIDEMTETEGAPNRECFAQGLANVVTGFFSGMGGCAMIGQSMINVSSGATKRLSGIVAASTLIGFVVFASQWIEMIPIAALVGVMVVVSEKTFEWGSIRALRKVPRHDAIVVVVVTAVTVMADLAVAVGVGVVISALVFAWQQAKHLDIQMVVEEGGKKTYVVTGSLFFASVTQFSAAFTPRDEAREIAIDFSRARVMDHSAIAAIDSIKTRYQQEGKSVTLLHLSAECRRRLQRASTVSDNDFVFGTPSGEPAF